MFTGTLFFIYFCVYFPRSSVWALPSPQQSASLVFFGPNSNVLDPGNNDSAIVTQFLVPSGTSSGGDQTTFELVEVDSTTAESVSGTALFTPTIFVTKTAELVASASGFSMEGTFTTLEGILGVTTLGSVMTFGEQCQATASDSGDCVIELEGSTETIGNGMASTQLIAISTPTSAPSSTPTGTSGSSKNGGFKREQYDQKLLVGLVFSTTILGIFSGGFLAL